MKELQRHPAGRWQRRSLLVAAGACAIAPAWSQGTTWNPTRPIRLVIPYPPGGGVDVTARALVDRIGEKLGQPLIIDNRAGAGGAIGGEIAYRAAPDGYTLLWATSEMLAVAPHLFLKLTYKPLEMVPIAPMGEIGFMLVARANLDAKSFPELIELARRQELSFASWGNGSAGHTGAEMLKHLAKVPKVLVVPYPGAASAAQSVLAGQVDLMYMPIPLWLGMQSRVTTLAVASKARYEHYRQVPAMAEFGVPVDLEGWQGIFSPPQTPKPIVERIAKALVEVTADAEVRKKLEDMGVVPPNRSQDEFAHLLLTDTRRWGEIMRIADVQPQ